MNIESYVLWKEKVGFIDGYINCILLLFALQAIVDKYGFPISQWAWLCQALLEVSMNKIAL